MNLSLAQSYARPTVARILRRYPNEVDDILQQAALKAWVHRRQFQGDSAYLTWFMQIARNEALMRLRQGRAVGDDLRHVSVETGSEAVQVPDRAPTPEQIAANREMDDILEQEIAALSPCVRNAVRLRLVEVPLDGTRKTQLFRARKMLRAQLTARGVTHA